MGSTDAEDRISNIPEQLLSHILSFLDMKEAVCTCAVSRSWRYQWLYVLCLSFDFNLWRTLSKCAIPSLCPGSDFDVLPVWVNQKNKEFTQFVSNVLSILPKGSSIQKFKLCNWKDSSHQVNTWIKSATIRNVQELHLENGNLFRTTLIGQIMTLKLVGVCFERMLCFSDEDFVFNLPFVENLVLHNCAYLNIKTFVILAPQLKYLSLREVIGVETDKPTIKIQAPKLISLHVKGTLSREISSLGDFPSLVMAEIDTVSLNLKDLDRRKMKVRYLMKILNSTCYAKSLTLSALCFQSCPKLLLESLKNLNQMEYQNAKYLNLTEWHMGGYINAVKKLLERFPNLESLALKGARYQLQAKFGSLYSWTPTLESPCKFYHLKNIEVKGFCRRDSTLEFLEFLVRNSMQLERITLVGGEYLSTCDEEQLMTTLTRSLTYRGISPQVWSSQVKKSEKHKKRENGKSKKNEVQLFDSSTVQVVYIRPS